MSQSKIKVMLVVFFDWKGIVHHESVPHDQMVSKQLYQEFIVHLRDAVCRKRLQLWENQTLMFQHDDMPAHMLLIHSYLAKHPTSIVPHPPYSPDLAPADFFLFPKLKTTLKGHHFQTRVD
jgi:histone-lysine N-methyltransferase SETMAR